GAAAQPTQLLLIKVVSTKDVEQPLAKPEGETVTPPAGLPTVKENDKGIPEISIDGAPAPTALVAQDLIKGKGAEIKATDQVVVNYVGVTQSDGKKFDSSYDAGKPATFPLSGVYKGWEQGLPGKTVGSRVLLVIPAALGNPDPSKGPQGDLVFVVDILGVK
ncbi:MAG TPA: peptidylprolyl isomerase, partial [Arthrobacter bacterium]|nr:peptidylprolyl isomerase [Arthrobacter sp.]HCB56591.1 peptidylprolyl isomerase [Arthrobacter sp.]HCN23613.1 peptidylprolyl isomerase [Arthrobacter sp.]